MKLYPKISIVTVNYNNGDFLEETIRSVIDQQYPNLEFILIDGGSTDKSLEIIRKYEAHFSYWISEKDEGPYAAVQKGFDKSTGDIMAWINSDDKYLPNALGVVADIFSKYEDVSWLMGQAREYTKEGALVGRITMPWCRWSKYRYLSNDYQFIQQESCFWRRSLWEKAGGRLDLSFDLAADMELWARFFRLEKLHTTVFELGGFRHRSDQQRSKQFLATYLQEAKQVVRRERALLGLKETLLLPFYFLCRWLLGPFFFLGIWPLSEFYPFFMGIPTLINYDFYRQDYVRKNRLIKHPPMVLGKWQIHRQLFKK